MDLTGRIAAHVAKTRFEDLPADVVDLTRRFILDTLAATLAGSSAPGTAEACRLARRWGGAPESTILVRGGRVAAPWAALANAVMAHARELDDTHDEGVVHAHVTALPAALAAAEARGGIPGSALIRAVALGVDLACRIGVAAARAAETSLPHLGFVRTSVAGVFGAAAAAGAVLGLDEAATRNALGIALSRATGTRQANADSALVKRMQPAFAAQDGLLAACLARQGVTGARQAFEGRYGLFALYFNGRADQVALLDRLGEAFAVTGLSFKPYPCCRYAHGAIEAALAIRRAPGFTVEHVARVEVHVPRSSAFDIVSKPWRITTSPQVDAQFSLQYTVATALLEGEVCLEAFEDAQVVGSPALALIPKITVHQDQTPSAPLGPVLVRVETAAGRTFEAGVEHYLGSPQKRMDQAAIEAKFRRCAEFADPPPGRDRIERALEMLRGLDRLADVRELTAAFG
jgi:2-methylcitrate dehydratase PrpD